MKNGENGRARRESMSYSKLEDTFHASPKVRRLARLLGCKPVTARGYLATLWSWTQIHAADGDLRDFTSDEIEFAVEWDGDPGVWFEAAVETKFIDKTEDGYEIHEWMDRAESFRKAEQAKQRREDKKSPSPEPLPDVGDTRATRGRHAGDNRPDVADTRNAEERRGSDRKGEERKREEEESSCGATLAAPFDPLIFPCDKKPPTWELTPAHVEKLRKAYPGVAIETECLKAHLYVEANPGKKKTAGGMMRYLMGWMGRSGTVPEGRQRTPEKVERGPRVVPGINESERAMEAMTHEESKRVPCPEDLAKEIARMTGRIGAKD